MTNKLIDCFEFEGELDLLKYRLDLLSNDVYYFIIFDKQDEYDIYDKVDPQLRKKIMILKNFDIHTNSVTFLDLLSKLNLDYEDVLSFSKVYELPKITNSQHIKNVCTFAPLVLESKVHDIISKSDLDNYERGSILMYYHTYHKDPSVLKTVQKEKYEGVHTQFFHKRKDGLFLVKKIVTTPKTLFFDFK